MNRYIVRLPDWMFDGDMPDEARIAYTDGVDAFACSAERVWFIECDDGYTGYVAPRELTIIGQE